MKKKMRFFVFWPIFKIKIAVKSAEIGLEYLDNRSRLMSKVEALQEHPLRLVKFINQFPLFQYSSNGNWLMNLTRRRGCSWSASILLINRLLLSKYSRPISALFTAILILKIGQNTKKRIFFFIAKLFLLQNQFFHRY